MQHILPYIQVILSLLLIGGVLLQRSEAGLGSAFGADGMSMGRFVRRGAEKTLFRATIAVATLFAIAAFLNLFLGR
ncbi:preprotein translocase subunit SecG [Candidatus Parcubacteria bacterium]|nr:preprotein translocase subunit SecG [Candidatus Parcubacteria bacterium]